MRQANSGSPEQAVQRLIEADPFGNIEDYTVLGKSAGHSGKFPRRGADDFANHALDNLRVLAFSRAQVGKYHTLRGNSGVQMDFNAARHQNYLPAVGFANERLEQR